MKKLATIVCAAALVVACAGQAGALNFELDGYTVDYRDTDPGLALYVNDLLMAPFEAIGAKPNIDLYTDGTGPDSVDFALFEIGTTESSVDPSFWEFWKSDEDEVHYDISVAFSFSSPEVDGIVTGESFGVIKCGDDEGVIEWDGPTLFTFGNGGEFQIALSDVTFGTPGSADVWGNLSFLSDSQPDPTAPVPEPASMLLLGSGLVGVAATMRKKKKA